MEEIKENIPEYEPTDEEIAEWERQRREAEEAKIKPFRDLGKRIRDDAQINAEQDDLIADLIYEQITDGMEV